jgi:hypothetical protein
MAISEYWRFADSFTVSQAAALWCDREPPLYSFNERDFPDDFHAIKQAMTGAVELGTLKSHRTDVAKYINDYSQARILRSDLAAWALSKKAKPAFLFDTLLPPVNVTLEAPLLVNENKFFSPTVEVQEPPKRDEPSRKNKGGRPTEYDWDGMFSEIVRIADVDNLPATKTELVTALQLWFSKANDGEEPAASSIHSRVGPIYDRLKQWNWEPNRR